MWAHGRRRKATVELPTIWEVPDDSSVHRTFQRWLARGGLDRVWARVAEAAGIAWDRQVVDGPMGKARLGGIASGPTPPTAASGG